MPYSMVPWRLWIPKISCTRADYFCLCRSEDNILYVQENVILHSATQMEKEERLLFVKQEALLKKPLEIIII